MNARYEIRRTFDGKYFFELYAGGSAPLLVGGERSTLTLCRNSIASVRLICDAHLEDVNGYCGDPTPEMPYPKFVAEKNKSRRYVFRLCAKNGKTVAESPGFVNTAALLTALANVRRTATFAGVSEKITDSFTRRT